MPIPASSPPPKNNLSFFPLGQEAGYNKQEVVL